MADEEEKDDLVTLVDVDDNEVTFRFLALVEIEEGTFAMLTPADDDGEDEMEVYLFHYDYDEDEEVENYASIEDQDLFQKVVAAAEELVVVEDDEGDEGEE